MEKQEYFSIRIAFVLILLLQLYVNVNGQFVAVGSGGYTTEFPGVDEAGRNGYPAGVPNVTGAATNKPLPTNDWWSAKLNSNHVSNLFNYPYTLKTVNQGLVVSYMPWGVIDDYLPVIVGVTGLNTYKSNISDFSDWTVTLDWNDGTHNFQATSGIGMPFLYFTKNSGDVAQVIINEGTVSISDEVLIIANAHNNADFAVYAPSGSTWTQNGNIYTSNLNEENYWSMAFIPLTASNVAAVANEYKKYAYVFPVNTVTSWNYDESTSIVRTDLTVETDVKEGTDSNMLLGLLPHQWANLAADSPYPQEYSYETIRGEMKTLDGNSFSVENTFHGILPTLPYVDYLSEGFSPTKQNEKVQLMENDGLPTWTDSYNEGQSMNRLIQTARIADLIGNTVARDKIHATVKARLEDWLLAEDGEIAFLFYYNETWTALLGYPAGHGQDNNLNDHHFHWGYFIHAAAFVEQFEPGWAEDWGEMIDYLVRDAACSTRTDEMFPFLRSFSPYAGHSWANGFATFPQGNDQESTSESMQFNSSLIHWGTITGNDAIRDLGIYLYTTEQTAVEEYWFDMYDRNFLPTQQYSLVSRIWGNSYDNGTFWTGDIAASYGIELYPIHGGSLYLGHNLDYVQTLWNEMAQNTGILINEPNDNLWHDVYWEYLAFLNPAEAIAMYDSYPERNLKYGISDAQTYHWLHAMNALGNVDASYTADYPIATTFNDSGGIVYTAHNYNNTPITVTFSDGYMLDVPANEMATSKGIALAGTLTSNFQQSFANGSVELTATINGGTPSKIEFYDGEVLLGEVTQLPYEYTAANLNVGVHGFYARVYDGTDYNITNITSVMVGRQMPYTGSAFSIPGIIEAGLYDIFEGGNGQGISYSDGSINNEGGFRPTEYVDAIIDQIEGATVGWISTGEWLEYSIDVQDPGLYSLDFRYASGNNNGGGPFHLELDGNTISDPITVNSTGDWYTWATKTVSNIPLSKGDHILKLSFTNGEFNLGHMTFTYSAPLPYDQPVADAGENIVVGLSGNSTTLDGSNSYDPGSNPLLYQWTQIYGPSLVTFSDDQIANPEISSLTEGYYLFNLEVSNGNYADSDEMYVIVSESSNIAPTVSISSPADMDEFIEGTAITITAEASDLDGTITDVEFYIDNEFLGIATSQPYSINWTASVGEYEITAVATDNGESSTTSAAVSIIFTPAPPCYGTSTNGEFEYVFSDDDENPTITFIPSLPGMGSPTCILYYGTNSSNLPGYYVTPNVPFQITAEGGSFIYFYYTYSYPGQGEHNNGSNPNTYVVGSCVATNTQALLPIDMEDPADDAWVGDGGAVYSLETAMFSPNTTGKIVGGTDQWNSRVDLALGTYIDMTTANKTFTFEYYTTEAVVMTGLFQIALEEEGGFPIEMTFTTNGAIGWETITLDFNNATNAYPNEGLPVVYGQYAQVSIFTNFGDTGSSTYYFDDIAGAANGAAVGAGPLPEPTTVPPTPPHAVADVISIYSETYTNVPGTDFNPNWGQSTTVSVDYVAAGNSTLKYETLNYQGTQFTSQNVSLYEYLHVDFWTPNSLDLGIYLISPGSEIEHIFTIVSETWVSVDIPLADFVPPVNLADVFQFKVEGTGTVYFDNLYFWKNPTSPLNDATLSDLQVDGVTVDGFSPTIFSYDVALPSGTSIIPTVTATTTNTNATHVFIPAGSLPGSTDVVVTAQDLTTMLTYSVNFTIAGSEPTTAPPTPPHAEADVISIYSDAYSNVPGTIYNPGWGQATIVTVDYVAAGNNTLKYENLNYQGTDWEANPQDVSGYEYLHVDFWTSNSTDLGIYLISPGPAEIEYVFTIVNDSWVSVDIPLTDFVPPVNLSEVFQFKVEGNGDIFFDNLYFWKTGSSGIAIDLKVFLEGSFNPFGMSTHLNSILPLNQPYNTSPWNYNGTETVLFIPNTSIVDWVLVEFRDAASASLATSGTMIRRQAAFLLQNGDVVGMDGSSNLIFDLGVTESLFVVIWHRNHLNVLSSVGLINTGGVYSYDFSTGAGQAYGGNLKDMGFGAWALYGGNGFADSQIDDLDKTSGWEPESGKSGYLQGDYDMNGEVDNLDKNDLWLLNNGTSSDGY